MASAPVLSTLALLVLSSLLLNTDGFSLKGFCASNCARGKGGNVCKCNGFHFAGKRADLALDAGTFNDNAKDEKFLELDSDGLGVFGYPRVDTRQKIGTKPNDSGHFQALLERFLSERYAREDQPSVWPASYTSE